MTERYFWSVDDCKVITEKALRADYDELKATDCDFRSMYSTFEQSPQSLLLLCGRDRAYTRYAAFMRYGAD